ncbi:MAG: DNA repair exonuclease [Candidatus Aenigmatarchaeota archaeon]
MYKFAHISDCHLGAWRDKTLREMNLDAFLRSMDACMENKVDFVLICGDLFDKNIPDLDIVERAAKKLRDVRNAGIEIYVIYGSHDYSPAATSIIDVLTSAGLFTKVMDVSDDVATKLRLNFLIDKKTGAKIAGISGRRTSLEKHYYEILDREALELEKGFRIFAFHIGVSELMADIVNDECVPVSLFPCGFEYYAGGHIHKRIEKNEKGYGLFVYPGATFGWQYNDLESAANGEDRGFYIVSFGEKVEKTEFVKTMVNDVKLFEINADNKTADEVKAIIDDTIMKNEFFNSIALVKIKGTLANGKPSDIEMQTIREKIYSKGAVNVFINRNALASKEFVDVQLRTDNRTSVEENVFRERIGLCDSYSSEDLKGGKGVDTAKRMLDSIKENKKDNETKGDYTERIVSQASHILAVKT